MPAKRCSVCNVNWPTASQYARCPVCQEPTWHGYYMDAITDEETRERITEEEVRRARIKSQEDAYREFEEYYAQRELERFRQELNSA